MYDQVYWTLTYGAIKHVTPLELVPELAPYTLLLDAISKAFCATGLRVGWAVMPPAIRRHMMDILGHVGAWAPKAEQVASPEAVSQALFDAWRRNDTRTVGQLATTTARNEILKRPPRCAL